ncbi:hypothetical protein [Enterococcus sp. AZ177]|uniref:hypothetical protein n=1 Tax=unclassified Enterococcus TaxID=2608891 RepID=UPI003D2FCBA4
MIKHLASFTMDSEYMEILEKNGNIYVVNFDSYDIEFFELEELCRDFYEEAEEDFEITYHDEEFKKECENMRQLCREKY